MYVRAVVNTIVENGHILLVRRKKSKEDPWSGDIALPGGMIKSGESIVDAGLRETFEETGILPESLYVYGVVGIEYPRNAPWLRTAILLSKPREELNIRPGPEVDDIFWFNPRHYNAYRLLFKDNRLVVGYSVHGGVLWGMTWRVIRKLIARSII